jgi:hypothetical protein
MVNVRFVHCRGSELRKLHCVENLRQRRLEMEESEDVLIVRWRAQRKGRRIGWQQQR